MNKTDTQKLEAPLNSAHEDEARTATPSLFALCAVADRRILAYGYADVLGAAVFPVSGKVPIVAAWAPYLNAPGIYGTDEQWEQATGYALAPVAGSPLVIIDLDDPSRREALLALCPSLRETFTVTSGSGHVHWYCRLAVGSLDKAYLTRRENDREIASLRGVSAYVVGPGSDYPSGGRYVPNDQPVVTLDLFEQTRLIEWFNPPDQTTDSPTSTHFGRAIRLHPAIELSETQYAGVETILRAQRFHQNGEWLNGACIHPENHKHRDEHASFGVNIDTGVGHCFTCGDYSPGEVAAALGVLSGAPPTFEGARPYAFVATPPLTPVSGPESTAPTTLSAFLSRTAPVAAQDRVQLELNITSELIRLRKHAAARLNDLIYDDSRRHHGQAIYCIAELVMLGQGHQLSRTQIVKVIKALCEIGLLVRIERGLYRRVSIAQARIVLGLGNEYALVEIPRAAYMGTVSVADYTAAVVLEIEHLLPKHLASGTIAAAIGISTQSLYDHEKRLKVERKTRAKVVNVATATPHFVKVFDDSEALVRTVSGDNVSHDAMKLAAQHGGYAWGWRMLPSTRCLPDEWSVPDRQRTLNIEQEPRKSGETQ